MKQLPLDLAESEIKIILEALIEKEVSMSRICSSSDDPDEIADIGNDLIELRLLLNLLKEKAIKMYGDQVVNFSTEVL